MQNKDKIAIFDFCETLANFQTADAYVKFVREQTNNISMRIKEQVRLFLVKIKVITILERLFKYSSIHKRLVLWQLKGINYKELDHYAELYYNNIIKKNLITIVVDELLSLKQNDWSIIIVSAGYEIYLKYFCLDFGISLDNLIAVKIKFKEENGVCMGIFDGGDRLWDKTGKLDQKYNRAEVLSVAYSDSISDLPMLGWANEGVVVRNRNKKNWSLKYNFREIIW